MNFIKKFITATTDEGMDESINKKVVQQSIESDQWLSWQKKLSEDYNIHRNLSNKKPVAKVRPLRTWLMASAAALLLLVSGIFLIKTLDETSPVKLADNYINTEKFAHPLELRSKGPEQDLSQMRTEAALAYIKNDYPAAISIGEQIIRQAAESSTDDHFFLGLSYVYNNQPSSAINQLLLAQQKGLLSGRFVQETDWFLALAYIKNEQHGMAAEILDKIIQNQQWMAEKALKLKEAMQQ